jgi:hypothetical protein
MELVFFAKNNCNDEVNEDMCRTCSTHGDKIIHIGYWCESKKERDYWEDLM